MSLYITNFCYSGIKKYLKQLFVERFVANELLLSLSRSLSPTTWFGGFASATPENDTARVNGGGGESRGGRGEFAGKYTIREPLSFLLFP